MADLAGIPKSVWKTKKQHRKDPPQQLKTKKNDIHPVKTLRYPKMTTATKRTSINAKIAFTPKNTETAVCALSGVQYHISQCLGETLTPCFLAVILSTVHYLTCLEMYDLLDHMILVNLVNKMYFT